MLNGLLIDYEYCTGCHSCEVACKEEHGFPVGKGGIKLYQDGPWEIDAKHVSWNKVPVPTDLCDLCAERLSRGRKPTCVHHCLAQCIEFGPVDELAMKLAEKPRQVFFVPDAKRAEELIPLALKDDGGADSPLDYLDGLDDVPVFESKTAGNDRELAQPEYEKNDSFRVAYMRYDVNNEDKSDEDGWV